MMISHRNFSVRPLASYNGLSGLICRALSLPPSYKETTSFCIFPFEEDRQKLMHFSLDLSECYTQSKRALQTRACTAHNVRSSKFLTIQQGDSYYFSILSNPCTLHWKNQADKASAPRPFCPNTVDTV